MSFINSWANLMDDVRLKGEKGSLKDNPYTNALGGFGIGGALEEWVNPITAVSGRNPLTSLISGKGNLAGSYEPQGGAEESLNRITATIGAGVGAYFGGAALGAWGAAGGGGEAAVGGGAAAGGGEAVGGGMGGLALGEGGSTAAGSMGGMTLAEGGYAGAGGVGYGAGAEAGAIGTEAGVGGGTAEGFSLPSWVSWKNATKALRLINSINRLRSRR